MDLLFQGGMRDISMYTRGLYPVGFQGCISSPVQVNNHNLVLSQAMDGRGVDSCDN